MNELTIIKQSVILFGREINYVMLCYVNGLDMGSTYYVVNWDFVELDKKKR